MKIKVTYTKFNTTVPRNVAKVYKVIPFGIPSGVPADIFEAKGDLIAGSGAGTYDNLPVGSAGQYLTPDPSAGLGLKWEIPSVAITDSTNFLINGGFDFAQRQAPGTLTTIAIDKYGPDRWRTTRENADLQYQRNDATSESGLTSMYYGRFKKITNAGKLMVLQIIEGVNTIPLRGKAVSFQIKMKASSSKTIRMAVIELQNAGAIDTIPASIVTAWNVDSTDPTLGSNLAVVTAAQSKSVTTSWQNFSVSVTVPSNSKNIICAIWSDADFSANDTLDLAEAGLYQGSTTLAWLPRHKNHEKALCERRYRKSYPLDTAPGTSGTNGYVNMYAASTSTLRGYVPLGMAGIPTITIYPSNGTSGKASTTALADIGTSVTAVVTTEAAIPALSDSGSGFTANTWYLFHYTAEIEL